MITSPLPRRSHVDLIFYLQFIISLRVGRAESSRSISGGDRGVRGERRKLRSYEMKTEGDLVAGLLDIAHASRISHWRCVNIASFFSGMVASVGIIYVSTVLNRMSKTSCTTVSFVHFMPRCPPCPNSSVNFGDIL